MLDEVIRLLESPHVMPTPTGGINYTPEHYFGLLHDFKRVRAELATADQPSCGQDNSSSLADALDAARYRWLRKGESDDVAVVRGLGAMDYGMSAVVYRYSEEIDGDDLDAAIDASLAAQHQEPTT